MFIRQWFHKIPRWMRLYYGLGGLWLATTAMHIPDGYLSPVTSAVLFLLALPFWIHGARSLKQKMTAKNVPLVALFAAFSFVIMMFNIPLPGGTTGHAVGGVLAAIILGPGPATIALTIALAIQAFFFGDGGILALGANAFNMAVVLPYVGYAVYQWIAGRSEAQSRRRVVGAAVGGWAGLTLASFFTAVEFGIQPALWHTAAGAPLYAPYPLSIAIPAMVIPHALVASVVEGAVTALVIAYLQRANQPALKMAAQSHVTVQTGALAKLRTLWIGLAALVALTPIGLLAPGTAWGEWGREELIHLGLGFVPQGMEKLSGLWSAPASGYNLPSLANPSLGYMLSGLVGVAVIVALFWLFAMLVSGRHETARVESERGR